jgi:uncharacterized glyoxalase superfamily protein PhnB
VTGSTYKRCTCRDTDGRLLDRKCPSLRKSDHGAWFFDLRADGRRYRKGRARKSPTPPRKIATMPGFEADPQIVPYLLYEEAGTAMDWLIRAFGFVERARDPADDGNVRHGELVLNGGGVIMLGNPGAGFRGPAKLGEATQLVCVTVTDLPAHRRRAQSIGAQVSDISLRADRAHSYTVDDPEGHRWYFSEPL